ncbi:hypothetical protein Tco_0752843 [Tanacetum coccineum]|uniref:Uncharacterized protein n=1 Tax=Tanacetum coccineum TaxID=301880 RepID=A0ABQ4ZAX0_9ASTR
MGSRGGVRVRCESGKGRMGGGGGWSGKVLKNGRGEKEGGRGSGGVLGRGGVGEGGDRRGAEGGGRKGGKGWGSEGGGWGVERGRRGVSGDGRGRRKGGGLGVWRGIGDKDVYFYFNLHSPSGVFIISSWNLTHSVRETLVI